MHTTAVHIKHKNKKINHQLVDLPNWLLMYKNVFPSNVLGNDRVLTSLKCATSSCPPLQCLDEKLHSVCVCIFNTIEPMCVDVIILETHILSFSPEPNLLRGTFTGCHPGIDSNRTGGEVFYFCLPLFFYYFNALHPLISPSVYVIDPYTTPFIYSHSLFSPPPLLLCLTLLPPFFPSLSLSLPPSLAVCGATTN